MRADRGSSGTRGPRLQGRAGAFVPDAGAHRTIRARPYGPVRVPVTIVMPSPNRSGSTRKTQVRCPPLGSPVSFWYGEERADPTHDAEVPYRGGVRVVSEGD